MAVTKVKRPGAIRQEEQAQVGQSVPVSDAPAVGQSYAVKTTNRPAVTRQQGGSLTYGPVQQSTPETIFKDAQAFYDSGNEAAGAEILYNYTTQMRDSNSPYYKPQYTTWDKDNGDEQKTLAAESDLLKMYTDVQTAVSKGYSDSWIKGNISTKNYPGLVALDNSTVLTRQLQYLGDDTVNGMIYAARNGGSKNASDILTSMYAYNLGWGNSYRPDYKSEAAKDPESEIYHPYMQGIHGEGKTAEEDTYAAKEELELLKQACRKRLEAGESVDSVYDAYFGNGLHGLDYGTSETEAAYPTLYAMEYARQNKTALALTEDVDFAAPYFKQWLYDQQDEINAIKGKANAETKARVQAELTKRFAENVPEAYQDLVWNAYLYDNGITDDDDAFEPKTLAGLDSWLKEYGLIGADDFATAFNAASAKLNEKWENEVMPSTDFDPALFVADGENIDPELNSRQVGFRLGMKQYLSGRAVTDSDAKAFVNKYGFLFNNYTLPTVDLSLGGMVENAKKGWLSVVDKARYSDTAGVDNQTPTYGRMQLIGSTLDAELDKLDAARENGDISDEEYFNCYLEVASAVDAYVAAGGGGFFGDYLKNTPAADGQSLEKSLTNSIDQTIAASTAQAEERKAANIAEVSKNFGDWERTSNEGREVEDPRYAEIVSIKINPSSYRGMDAKEYDAEYSIAYNYAMNTYNSADYSEHYSSNYADLASYDVAEVVNDVMRLAQYTGTDFATARKAMGFETYEDFEEYLYNYNYTVNKQYAGVIETLWGIGSKIMASAGKIRNAEELLEKGEIDQETFDKFRRAIGTSENEAAFYEKLNQTKGAGRGGGKITNNVENAIGVYKDAMSQRLPEEGIAYGNSSNIKDILGYGVKGGAITHKDSWVMAALGFMEMTPDERENYVRGLYNNDPKAYRRVLEDAINDVDNPKMRDAYMLELANYTGDIFKFDFDPGFITGELNDVHTDLSAQKEALDKEMQGLLTPAAYRWYNNTVSAVNSSALSVEAMLITATLSKFGMSKSAAALWGQMLTTAPVEGGETAHTLKQAGINSATADLAGIAVGMATAYSEYGLEGLIEKGLYKSPWARRISDFGKINVAAKGLQVAKAMEGKKGAGLVTFGAKSVLHGLNWLKDTALGVPFEIVQEEQQKFTSEALMSAFTGQNFFSSAEEYYKLANQTAGSSILQAAGPVSVGSSIMENSRAGSQQKDFINEFGQTSSEINARGKAEVGTAQSLVDQAQAEMDSALAERKAAMDRLRAMNLEARVDQDTVQNLVNPAMELFNSEMTQKIDDLVAKGNSLNDQLATMESKVGEMSDMATEARAAVEQGDVSKEALDHLTETTDLMRSLDMAMEQTRADIKTNDEQLAKLKAEKQALRQQAYEKARQEAIESVTDEATKEEVAKRKHEVEQAEALVEDAKAKHEAAKTRLQDALNAYQEELKTLQTEARAKQDLVNGIAEEDIISNGLVDAVLGISNVLDEVDVYEASAKENTFKQELLHMMELSFPGYKVEFRNLGRGQMGKVVVEDGKGVIVLNRDSTSFELMNGELGYEIAQIAQIDQDGYKPLYDAVTNAVYGGEAGTEAAFKQAQEDAVKNGASTDLTQPNNYYDQAGSAVFANAIGRLLSGEFKDSGWVKKFSDKAPELAGDIFDWIAMRTKEFKAIAKHGDMQTKAQYNEIIGVLGQLSAALGKVNTIDYTGQTVDVDLSPVADNETKTDDAAEFMNAIVHDKNTRYVGEKRLPLFERHSDGTFTIDRNQLTPEENELINDVITADKQAEYNALNGEVTAESLIDELIEATTPATAQLTEAQRAENTKAKVEQLEERENRLEREQPVTVAEEQTAQEETTPTTEEQTAETAPADQEAPATEQTTEEQQEQTTEETTEQATEETGLTTTQQEETLEGEVEQAQQETEQTKPQLTEAQQAIVDGVVDTLARVNEFDEATRTKVLGKIRGVINSIKNGNSSLGGDATNTPPAILKNMLDSIGATLYQGMPLGKNVLTQLNSAAGFVYSKNLTIRDTNALIDAAADHVMNQIEHDAAEGQTTGLSENSREQNTALFNAWFTSGISGLKGLSDMAKEAVEDFGGKLHLALANSKQGRAMYEALTNAKDKLTAYYNADAIRKAAAYVRSTPESQQSGDFSKWMKTKAYWLGQDVYGALFDSMTGNKTQFRKKLRYIPYAKSLGNMWVGDHETAKGFVDLDHNPVEGAMTMTEAIKAPFKGMGRFFAKNKNLIYESLGQLLAIDSALDRYNPVERDGKMVNRDPFTNLSTEALSEAAQFLGIEGHPTKESLQKAKEALEQKIPQLEQAAENVREWWRNCLQLAVKEGAVSQEEYDRFQTENPNYAPLQRDMSTITNKRGKVKGTTSTQGELDISGAGISFRQAKGHSDRAIINPLQSFTEMAQQLADKLEANRTAQEFVRVYDQAHYDTIGVFAGEISNGQEKVLTKKGTDDVLNVYYQDGTHRSFVVNNPELLQLLEGKQLNSDKNGWMKALAPVTRFMARLTTTDNPIFAIRNAIRDYQTSVNYGSWASNYVTGLPKWISAFAECLRYTYSKSLNELFHDDNSGKLGKKGRGPSQQLEDFLFRGGEGFMRKSMTKNDKSSVYNELMGTNWAKRTLSAGYDLLTFGTLNDAVEMASRYVEYKYGKNETKDSEGTTDQSKFNAFMASREVTVDFAQAGYGTFAKTLRQVIPFFNATLQGSYRTARMFNKEERGRLGARLTKTVTNNVISGALSAAMNLFGKSLFGSLIGGDDEWDEQAEEYLKISDSLKNDFIILPLSGLGIPSHKDFIRVPLLQDALGKWSFNTGRLAVENVAKKLRGEDVEISDFGMDMLNMSWNVLKDGVKTDFIFTPVIDMMRNTTYYGTALVNESKLDKDPSTWGNASTPQMAFDISNGLRGALKSLFGGELPQWANLLTSPAGVEYTFKEFFGYPGQVILPIISRDRYNEGEMKGLKGLGETIVGQFTIDAESSNDISADCKAGIDLIKKISGLDEYGGIGPLPSFLTVEERNEAVRIAKEALKKGGILYEGQKKRSDLWSQFYAIMGDSSLSDKEKVELSEAIRKEINDLESEMSVWCEAYKAKYDPDLGIIGGMIDSIKAGRQTMQDSGEGLASRGEVLPDPDPNQQLVTGSEDSTTPTAATEPATETETASEPEGLQMVKADIGADLSSLSRSIPLGEEEETPRAPETSPEYTGERARGIETEYQTTDPASARRVSAYRNGDNVYTRAGRKYTGDTTIRLPEKSKLHPESVMPQTMDTIEAYGKKQNRATVGNAIKAVMERGNVDLLKRPSIPASSLQKAGWDDAGDGTATVFSVMYTAGNSSNYDYKWGNNTVFHLTPIQADGAVQSPQQLEAYMDKLLSKGTIAEVLEADKPSNGGLGLILWAQPVTGTLGRAMQVGDAYDENLHKMQAAYYLNDYGDMPTADELSSMGFAQTQQPAMASTPATQNTSALGQSMAGEFMNVGSRPFTGTTTQTTPTTPTRQQTTAPTPAESKYNIVGNVADVKQAYTVSRKEYGDQAAYDSIGILYGDSLPKEYYTELADLMNYNSKKEKLLPLPPTKFTRNGTEYVIADYAGAETDFMNWYGDYFAANVVRVMSSAKYQNADKAGRVELMAKLDDSATSWAKDKFMKKYVEKSSTVKATPITASTTPKATTTTKPAETTTATQPTATTQPAATEAPKAQEPAKQYKISANTDNVTQTLSINRSDYTNTLCGIKIRKLYGDALPESYYTDLAKYLKADKSTNLLPLPPSSMTKSNVTYEFKNYPGAEADVLDWYADSFIPEYNSLIASAEWQQASDSDRMDMLKSLDKAADKYVKSQFMSKYVK